MTSLSTLFKSSSNSSEHPVPTLLNGTEPEDRVAMASDKIKATIYTTLNIYKGICARMYSQPCTCNGRNQFEGQSEEELECHEASQWDFEMKNGHRK